LYTSSCVRCGIRKHARLMCVILLLLLLLLLAAVMAMMMLMQLTL